MGERLAGQTSRRRIEWWNQGKDNDELEQAARKMLQAEDHIFSNLSLFRGDAAVDNVVSLWRLMQEISEDRCPIIEGQGTHSIIIGRLPHRIKRKIWRYSISVASSHACLLLCSEETSLSAFRAASIERDDKWIECCKKQKHQQPIIHVI